MHAALQHSIDWDHFSVVLDAFPTGVVVTDENGRINYANAVLSRQFGYEREELLGEPVEMLLPEDYRGRHPEHIRRYMTNPEKRSMGSGRELFGRRKDGSRFPIEIGLNPIMTQHGRQIIATVADISHRRRLEQNFRQIVDAAPVGMLMVDQHGRIAMGNERLLEIFGYTLAELQGQPLEVLLPERHRDHHVAYRDAFIATPETRTMGVGRELTGRHKYGMEVPVEIGLNPIETEDGPGVIAAVNDISERRKVELSLRQANADLDEFTYVASHDLRSPLRGISSLLEWIEDDLGDGVPGEVRHNIERCKVRIQRMESLIDDLLDYARAGSSDDALEDFDPRQLIERTVDLLALPQGFRVEVSCELDALHTARTPLETVLRNLIGNAFKHHDRDEGRVEVSVKAQNSFACFEVKDDGPGIKQVAHERIFKLFQTLNGGGRETHSGVGLAVTRRLIEARGGRIELESGDAQRGALFRFWWPRFPRSDLNERQR